MSELSNPWEARELSAEDNPPQRRCPAKGIQVKRRPVFEQLEDRTVLSAGPVQGAELEAASSVPSVAEVAVVSTVDSAEEGTASNQGKGQGGVFEPLPDVVETPPPKTAGQFELPIATFVGQEIPPGGIGGIDPRPVPQESSPSAEQTPSIAQAPSTPSPVLGQQGEPRPLQEETVQKKPGQFELPVGSFVGQEVPLGGVAMNLTGANQQPLEEASVSKADQLVFTGVDSGEQSVSNQSTGTENPSGVAVGLDPQATTGDKVAGQFDLPLASFVGQNIPPGGIGGGDLDPVAQPLTENSVPETTPAETRLAENTAPENSVAESYSSPTDKYAEKDPPAFKKVGVVMRTKSFSFDKLDRK